MSEINPQEQSINTLRTMLSQQRYEELHALWASQDTRKNKTAIHYQREAALYELERNLILALEFYRKAHLLAPNDAYIALDLARINGLISHVRETKFWYQRALELDPNILDKVVLARSTGFLGREHELNFFNKFIKSKKTHQLASFIKAEHLLALRREAEAILELTKLTDSQWVKKAVLIRGLAHFLLGQFEVAKKQFAKCPSLTENPFINKLFTHKISLGFGKSDLLYKAQNLLNAPLNPLKDVLENVDGWLSPFEGACLFQAAKHCSEGVIVEIGSWKGRSTLCLGLGSQVGFQRPIFAVDPHEWSDSPFSTSTFPEWQQNIRKYGPEWLIIPVRSNSVEAARNWTHPVGVLFIDGDHQFEAILTDIQGWIPHCLHGALILFHDANFEEVYPVLEEKIFKSKKFRVLDVVEGLLIVQYLNPPLQTRSGYEMGCWTLLNFLYQGLLGYRQRCGKMLQDLILQCYEQIRKMDSIL